MARPVERCLFAVILAGLAASAAVLWTSAPRSAPVQPAPAAAPVPVAAAPDAAPASSAAPADSSAAAVSDGPSAPAASSSAAASVAPPSEAQAGPSPEFDAWEGAHPAPPASPAPSAAAAPSAADAEPPEREGFPAAAPPPGEEGAPVRCALVEELWEADGLPVEDPCTLAEVARVLRWAWAGGDEQRRAAIRNGGLLDEVFEALDRYGRERGASLFHPDERRQFEVSLDDVRWQGGPAYDAAVIGVVYRLEHPDLGAAEPVLDTLVQVDGEWKLSYRRSFCVKVMVIMEYTGSSVRCPRDPHPEVNEDEAPGATGRYY